MTEGPGPAQAVVVICGLSFVESPPEAATDRHLQYHHQTVLSAPPGLHAAGAGAGAGAGAALEGLQEALQAAPSRADAAEGR